MRQRNWLLIVTVAAALRKLDLERRLKEAETLMKKHSQGERP